MRAHAHPLLNGRRGLDRIDRSDRGAAMVEMAFMMPILLMLTVGAIEFGRGYNAKIELTGAAREGARALALGKTSAEAQAAVVNGAPGLNITAANVSTVSCPASGIGDASVTATYPVPYSIPFVFQGTWNITITSVMRCGL